MPSAMTTSSYGVAIRSGERASGLSAFPVPTGCAVEHTHRAGHAKDAESHARNNYGMTDVTGAPTKTILESCTPISMHNSPRSPRKRRSGAQPASVARYPHRVHTVAGAD